MNTRNRRSFTKRIALGLACIVGLLLLWSPAARAQELTARQIAALVLTFPITVQNNGGPMPAASKSCAKPGVVAPCVILSKDNAVVGVGTRVDWQLENTTPGAANPFNSFQAGEASAKIVFINGAFNNLTSSLVVPNAAGLVASSFTVPFAGVSDYQIVYYSDAAGTQVVRTVDPTLASAPGLPPVGAAALAVVLGLTGMYLVRGRRNWRLA